MNCPDCEDKKKADPDCLRCGGIGEICEICGEPSEDFGLNVCAACENENGDEH